MKQKTFWVALMALVLSCMSLAAQPRYLTSVHKPVDSEYYDAGTSREIGGLKWGHGFTLGSDVEGERQGSVSFRIGGQYEKIMFVLGLDNNTIYSGNRVATVYADGRKILDEVVRPNSVAKRITLDLKGVNELKFVLVTGMGDVCFKEITLWKAGESPRETGNTVSGKPSKKQLVKDLRPYKVENGHYTVSPTDRNKSVKIGNTQYDYGLVCSMVMALIGNNASNTYFNLQGQYGTLSFLAGAVNTSSSHNGKGWITVMGDGKILHEHEFMQGDIPKRTTVDVSGVHQLQFLSEQTAGDGLYGAVVDAWLYPEGESVPTEAEGVTPGTDSRLKALPDVCKLISNIPPYAVRGQVEHQVYTGESDYITFSMGGTKFSEGFILYEKADFMDDDVVSYAMFDLGNEFDYVSFTAGYVGKSWVMNNDMLRVYADDELILQVPLMATYPNQKFVLPLKKCRKLRFENGGQGTMDVAAFGVADLVVYRGEPVENDLFLHPKPECPYEIDLIDLGKPYIHYISSLQQNIFYDGTSQRNYVTMRDGTRINKGFMLKTSVHFSLDHGVLSDQGGDSMSGVIGATAVGSAFVASSVAVGGAVVGSTLMGVAAFMVLAAGGEAVENSCAAFNTYGEYNSLTFTVACLRTRGEAQLLGPDSYDTNSDYKETLLIGADQKVVAELTVFESMKPQTVTVPIDGCKQLMFWLANTYNTSAIYFFYDLKLSKDKCELYIPKDARLSKPVITEPQWTEKTIVNAWKRQSSTGAKYLDQYLRNLSIAYENTEKYLKSMVPDYEIYTYYLDTEAGQVCKGVKLKTRSDDQWRSGYKRIPSIHSGLAGELKNLAELKNSLAELTLDQANAYLDIPSLGLGAIGIGKLMKQSGKVLKELKELADRMYNEKLAEYAFVDAVFSTAVDIDGRSSTEEAMICPLFKGETPPEGDRMQVKNFTL